MAIGLSGSNGGIVRGERLGSEVPIRFGEDSPLEVSYFVNDVCNLRCKHCYVGYHNNNGLTVLEFEDIFKNLMDLGATTFGNVGMEPLVHWEGKTLPLLRFFQEKHQVNSHLRYGFVTNATLFNDRRIGQLADVEPTYFDVSIDGPREVHDSIRGNGSFDKTAEALRAIFQKYPSFADRTFISLTLMKPNSEEEVLTRFFDDVKTLGARKVLVSPYVSSINTHSPGELWLSEEEIGRVYQHLIDWQDRFLQKGGQLLLKSDYDTQKPLIDHLVEMGVIDINNLFIDSYGVVFNRYSGCKGETLVNYILGPSVTQRQIRISHDGYIGNCYGMFFPDFERTSLGNVRNATHERLEEITSSGKLASVMVPLEGRLNGVSQTLSV